MKSIEEINYVNEVAPRAVGKALYHADCVPADTDEDDVDVRYHDDFRTSGALCVECGEWIIEPKSKSVMRRINAQRG